MYRSVARLAVILLLFVTSGLLTPAHAAKRVALVIGNSSYEQATPLNNAKNDADALAAVLKRLGFDVIKGIDLNRSRFEGTVRKFARAIRGADVALLFYAGHGLQVNGRNYLAPIDAKLSDEADLVFETLKLEDILAQMERETRINLVFLDACRDNPLARNLARSMGTRSANVGRGLARVETGVGTLIAFATEPGNVALDGKGSNSPFTEALLKHIETPDLDIAKLMRRVRKEVLDTTAGKQVPWSNSSLTGDFVFAAARQIEVETRPETKPTAVVKETPKADKKSIELAYWDSIKESESTDAFESYIKRFPGGVFSDLARIRLEELKQHKKTAAVAPARPAATATPDVGKRRGEELYELGHAAKRKQEYAKAVQFFQESADLSYGRGIKSLGYMYAMGRGVTRDLSKAKQLYLDAEKRLKQEIASGDAKAMYSLGWMYRNGEGVPTDLGETLRLWRKAAELDARYVKRSLARLYDRGAPGIARDHVEAAKWVARALKTNNYALKEISRKPQVWSKETRAELQRILRKKGFYRGRIDGEFGAGTMRAIKRYAGQS